MAVRIMGYDVFTGSVEQCAQEIVRESMSRRRDCKVIACLNPHSYVVSRSDIKFRAALEQADWLLPDGAGIVLVARWLGLIIPNRVTGPDVFMAVLRRLQQNRGSVFFLGASEQTLEKIKMRLAAEYPDVVVAGMYSPPFKAQFSDQETAAMISAINSAQPDVLWVGMTAPKQEKWIAQHRSQLKVGSAGAVGAAFDFFAGTVKRSPKVFRSLGLEWLPRLIRQPRRLWRRTFVSAPIFILDAYKFHRSQKKKY